MSRLLSQPLFDFLLLYHKCRCPSSSLIRRLQTLSDIKLRQYQEECIQSVLSSLNEGKRRLGVSLATGSGKTVIFSRLIDRVPPNPATSGSQTLILVHRRELVEQAVKHCAAAYPQKQIEIEMGKQHASGVADITVASVQSINSGNRMSKFNPEHFKLILVDEAHHIVASTYKNVLRHMGLWQDCDHTAAPALVGVSATLGRFDGLKLGAALDHIVYHRDYIDMIQDHWLADVIFTTIQTHVDLSKVKTASSGDYHVKNLSLACNTNQTNDLTVRSWFARAKDRKATLVFCVDKAHVIDLTRSFRKHGIDARYVLGDTDLELRAKTLADFKNGRFPVLLNCGVFTEGTDMPNVDCILLGRPTKSRNLLIQMIGRGMRLHTGKENCHIIDMVASLDAGVTTVPTLFGLDPDSIVQEATLDDLKALSSNKDSEAGSSEVSQIPPNDDGLFSHVSFTDYESIEDLLEDRSGDKHIRAMSLYAWVHIPGDDRYIVSSKSGNSVIIERNESSADGPAFRVRLNQKAGNASRFHDKWRPFRKSEEIATAHDLESAVRAADTFISGSPLFERRVVTRAASWRLDQATDGQLEFLNKTIGKEQPIARDNMTKGQAADMITKIKFGARGKYQKLAAAARRSDQQRLRTEERKSRESVRVGPIVS